MPLYLEFLQWQEMSYSGFIGFSLMIPREIKVLIGADICNTDMWLENTHHMHSYTWKHALILKLSGKHCIIMSMSQNNTLDFSDCVFMWQGRLSSWR